VGLPGAPVALATLALDLTVIGLAARRAPWRRWLGRGDRQHVYFASLVLLSLVGSMRAGLTPGLPLHFLLMSALTLMQGTALALVAAALVTAAEALWHGTVSAWPAGFACAGLVPIVATTLIHRVVARFLPHHYFVYFFVTVFAGSMIAFALGALARVGLLALSGTLPDGAALGEFLMLVPIVGFGEGVLNGLVMAVAVVYAPQWVQSFDDRTYLRR
jgi:uncharacterized membrane protein